MSKTFTVHPILGCLSEAEKFIGYMRWEAVNSTQKRFLNTCIEEGMADVWRLQDQGERLKCKASCNISEINKWLSDNGFPDLQLTPCDDPTAFSVASILEILLQWEKAGEEVTITEGGNYGYVYPAVYLNYESIKIFTVKDHDKPIAYIPTKRKGEYVLMTIYPGMKNALHWILGANQVRIHRESYPSYEEYKGIIFPEIDYNEKVDISFMKGMENPGPDPDLPPWYIHEMIQQTRFQMNHIGAKVESAAAATIRMRGIEKKIEPLMIDQPFLMGVFREELDLPYFLGHFTTEHWDSPEINFEEKD